MAYNTFTQAELQLITDMGSDRLFLVSDEGLGFKDACTELLGKLEQEVLDDHVEVLDDPIFSLIGKLYLMTKGANVSVDGE